MWPLFGLITTSKCDDVFAQRQTPSCFCPHQSAHWYADILERGTLFHRNLRMKCVSTCSFICDLSMFTKKIIVVFLMYIKIDLCWLIIVTQTDSDTSDTDRATTLLLTIVVLVQ